MKAAILAHDPRDPEWHRHVGLDAAGLERYDALRVEWEAMHETYRQWSMADGNEATPMEVYALTKGKGKEKGKEIEKGKEKGKEKSRGKCKDKPKEGTPDKSSMKCFFCEEKGHARKDCPEFSARPRKRQWVTSSVRMPSERFVSLIVNTVH